jgi:hypothetical protein
MESYDLLRNNTIVTTRSKICHKPGNVLGLDEIYTTRFTRNTTIKSTGVSKLLFIPINSLKRFLNLQ